MKRNNVFWGIVFVVMAVLVIVGQLGVIEGLSFWKIALSVFFGAAFINGLVKFDIYQIFFSIAFLYVIWDEVLGFPYISSWTVLVAALFASIGFSMIFGNRKKKKYYEKINNGSCENNHNKYENDQVEYDYGEEIKCSVKFASTVKYANSDNLRSVDISAAFGAASVYFSDAKVPLGEVIVSIDASFAGIELYVPKDWHVTNNMQANIGGVSEKNRSSGSNTVNLVLVGSVNFSGVEIHYV